MVIAGTNLSALDATPRTSVFAPGTEPGIGVGAGMGTGSETGSGPALGPASGPTPESASASAPLVAKTKRRFAPQLIERTSKTSSSGGHQPVSFPDNESHANTKPDIGTENNPTKSKDGQSVSVSPGTISNAAQTNRDGGTSFQLKDSDNSTSRPSTRNIRRFAPVPIETTFDSYRVANKDSHESVPEPTPDPSPTTSQSSAAFPPATALNTSGTTQTTAQTKNHKRRFAPQLIETTRKSKRAGQEGPAMQPTDKTDITPGTNHIYASRPKSKHGATRLNKNSAELANNTEAENAVTSPRSFAPRRKRGMRARANTGRSMRHNSYHPELDTILSSESGNSSEDDSEPVPALNLGAAALYDTQSDLADTWSTRGYDLRNRRESCDEEISGYLLGIAAREALRQREFEQALSAFPNGMPPQGVEHFFARDNSEDDLQIGDESPLRHGPSQLLRRKSTDPGWAVQEMRAHAEKLARMRGEAHTGLDHKPAASEMTPPPDNPLWTATTARRMSRDSAIRNSTDSLLSTNSPVLSARLPPGYDKLFTPPPSTGVHTSPFGMGFAFRTSEPEDDDLGKMRKAASPPMLGADLNFRTCPSPQYTRMEPDHPYPHSERFDESQRDRSDTTGLWRGYCSSKASKLEPTSLQPPDLLHTPSVYSTIDPFAAAFGTSTINSDELSPAYALGAMQTNLEVQHLSEFHEKFEKESKSQELEEPLLAEFDDQFVTQVYNYLSLGYPATARAFDHELSKISGICLKELRKDDNVEVGKGFMREMEISLSRGSTDSGCGDESSGDERMAASPVEYERRPRYKTPRWKALKLYIHEWARQHPSLNDDGDASPPAWGVRARRGSWAI